MFVDIGLDLEARDVLGPAPDGVLHTVDEVQVALRVTAKRVAGVEPAVAPRLDRLVGHAEVAAIHAPWLGRAHDQLADVTVGNRAVVLVDDPKLVTGKS